MINNTHNTSSHSSNRSTQSLLPPTNDYVFARLFGSNSHRRVLVCLLNAILNGKPNVKDVTLDPTEYKKTTADGKSIRLDIRATTDNGTVVNVEIQCVNTGDMHSRSLYYQSLILREYTIKQGQSYKDIPNIITIWIMNEPVTERKGCMHEIVPMYKDNGIDKIEIASEKMRQFIIELTKLENTPKSFYNDMFSIWMMFIQNPESIPEEFLKIEEVKEALEELTYLSQDKETRAEYNARHKELCDQFSSNTVSYEKGVGEGEKKKAFEIARKMLAKDFGIEDIIEYSGLTKEEILKLQKENVSG